MKSLAILPFKFSRFTCKREFTNKSGVSKICRFAAAFAGANF